MDAASLPAQVRELLTSYGDVFQLSFASADPAVDWAALAALVAELSPETVLHHGGEPHVRRVGLLPGETCWGPSSENVSSDGDAQGTRWLAPQADAPLPADLLEFEQLTLDTIGRGANLALELWLEGDGSLADRDVALLAEFGALLQATFDDDLARSARVFASNTRNKSGLYAPARVADGRPGTYWATDDGIGRCFIDLELTFPELVDTVVLCEPIAFGQRVRSFRVQGKRDNLWKDLHVGTTIGVRRFLRVPPGTYQGFRLVVEEVRACPLISTFSLYLSPPKVEVHADETVYLGQTRVRFTTSNPRALVRYTTDGSLPTESSTLYTQALMVGESCTLTALAFTPSNPGLVPAQVELRAYTRESLRAPEEQAPGERGLNGARLARRVVEPGRGGLERDAGRGARRHDPRRDAGRGGARAGPDRLREGAARRYLRLLHSRRRTGAHVHRRRSDIGLGRDAGTPGGGRAQGRLAARANRAARR